MKGFVCKVCGFISINGSSPEKCPVCGAPKSSFEEKEDAIKTPQDNVNLGESDKKHIPDITVVKKCGLIPQGCQDVHVKVGQIQHPMEDKHYIVHIDFYIDKEFISRVILTPGKLNPAAALHLRPFPLKDREGLSSGIKAQSGRLSAIELCNIHGAWINEVDL